MGRTVGELENELSAAEFAEWQAFDRLDPFGGYRQDLQTAHILAAKYADKNSTLADFLPVDPYPMTDEQREAFELEKARREIEAQQAALIAQFERLERGG